MPDDKLKKNPEAIPATFNNTYRTEWKIWPWLDAS